MNLECLRKTSSRLDHGLGLCERHEKFGKLECLQTLGIPYYITVETCSGRFGGSKRISGTTPTGSTPSDLISDLIIEKPFPEGRHRRKGTNQVICGCRVRPYFANSLGGAAEAADSGSIPQQDTMPSNKK